MYKSETVYKYRERYESIVSSKSSIFFIDNKCKQWPQNSNTTSIKQLKPKNLLIAHFLRQSHYEEAAGSLKQLIYILKKEALAAFNTNKYKLWNLFNLGRGSRSSSDQISLLLMRCSIWKCSLLFFFIIKRFSLRRNCTSTAPHHNGKICILSHEITFAYELYTKNNHEAGIALVMQSVQYIYFVKTVTCQFSDERSSVRFNRTRAW